MKIPFEEVLKTWTNKNIVENLMSKLTKYQLDEDVSIMDIAKIIGFKDTYLLLRYAEWKPVMLFHADVAELTLEYYENLCPNNDELRNLINASRGFVNGIISESDLRLIKGSAETYISKLEYENKNKLFIDRKIIDKRVDILNSATMIVDFYRNVTNGNTTCVCMVFNDKWVETEKRIEELFIKHFKLL